MGSSLVETGMSKKPRAWQRMLSGRRLDLLDPSPVDIEIEDIAHGLARVARWNGQTTGDWAFSVAQHSVIVEQVMADLQPDLEIKWRLAGLLHDAPEYVVGDMISPFKAAMGVDFKSLENRLQEAIHIRFSIPPLVPKKVQALIKKADKASAYFEATQIAGFGEVEARKFWGPPKTALKIDATPWPISEAKRVFLDRFEALTNQL